MTKECIRCNISSPQMPPPSSSILLLLILILLFLLLLLLLLLLPLIFSRFRREVESLRGKLEVLGGEGGRIYAVQEA